MTEINDFERRLKAGSAMMSKGSIHEAEIQHKKLER
jgi:hypothetical protein